MRAGESVPAVAERFGVSVRSVRSWSAELGLVKRRPRNRNRVSQREAYRAVVLDGDDAPPPIRFEALGAAARRALDDFGYFRRRYFGRISSPWQERAGRELVELLESPDDEKVVINCPPGAGKSTLIHDVACWVICRDRAVRILIVSNSQRNAEKYSLRIRRSLERRFPLRAEPRLLALGLAVDAEATLVADFGRFRPAAESLWRKEEYVVEQLAGETLENKEPTVAAYGLDSEVIGHRADVVLPDDAATPNNAREGADRDNLIERWGVIEARVEPGGLIAQVGQRLSSTDLSKHCLSQLAGDDDDEEIETVEGDDDVRRVYRHIVYRAYYPEFDTGPESRRRNAPPWPHGPLLDPRRITWKKISALRQNKPDLFATQYQQEDGAKSDRLVQEVWVFGGTDTDGAMYPGCIDKRRRLGQIPHLEGPVVSVGSVDPSSTKNWAFMWELYEPVRDYRHVVGLHRGPMSADNVLSWDLTNRESVGLMVEWQQQSINAGHPITHWIVEENIAKHMLSFAHVRRWMADARVRIVAHTTTRYNKHHAELGIQAIIPPIWRHGRIRLPDRAGCWQVEAFIQEHLSWRPDKRSGTDFVMAGWFPELHWPNIRPAKPLPRLPVPGWLEREAIPA